MFISSALATPARSRRVSHSLFGAFVSLILAGVLSMFAAVSAQAAGTGTCPASTVSQPFLKWADANYYSLVPQGDFEGPVSEWNLSGGAKQVMGSESYGVSGKVGGYSMLIPQGATVRSPFMCVTEVDRTFRLFARSEGSPSTLRAEVVYKILGGNLAIKVASLSVSGTWQPTVIMHTGAAAVTELTNGTAQLALRFTSVTGSTRIDDVYLDPRRR